MTYRRFLPLTALTAGLLISVPASAESSLLAVYCQTDTDNAVIYVDGQESSTCSEGERKVIPVNPGAHRVDVVRSHGPEYEQRFTTDISAEAGRPVRVRVNLPEKTMTAYGEQMAVERLQASRLAAEKAAFEKNLSAASQGDIRAMDAVASSYQSGTGVEKNPQQASYWQQQASATRQAMQEEKEQQEFKAALAKANDEQAPVQERITAIDNLVRYYVDGYGTEIDAGKAKEWQARRQQLQAASERDERIAAAQQELDGVIYFPFVRSAPEVMSRGGSDSSTYFTLLPMATAMDIVSLPSTTTEHIAASSKLKDAESHASRWANPESMMAQSFSE